MLKNGKYAMKYKLPILCCIALIVTTFPNRLYSGNPSIPSLSFEPFDDDPAIYNDCNYCHVHHNAQKGVPALLNKNEERYRRYLKSQASSALDEQSIFDSESSRKCPRSRAKKSR